MGVGVQPECRIYALSYEDPEGVPSPYEDTQRARKSRAERVEEAARAGRRGDQGLFDEL